MAKTCLNKLNTNIVQTCELPIHGVKELYIMHVEDVTVSVASDASWSAVSFATGAKSVKVEGYKQNIQVTSSVRSSDASNKLDFSVMFKVPNSTSGTLAGLIFQRAILTGRFYVLVVMNDSTNFIVGAQSPLECSGYDWDSNTNGLLRTITLTAPDGSSGNYMGAIAPAAVNSITSNSY